METCWHDNAVISESRSVCGRFAHLFRWSWCQGKVGGTACRLAPSPCRADSKTGRHTVGCVATSVVISMAQQQDYSVSGCNWLATIPIDENLNDLYNGVWSDSTVNHVPLT